MIFGDDLDSGCVQFCDNGYHGSSPVLAGVIIQQLPWELPGQQLPVPGVQFPLHKGDEFLTGMLLVLLLRSCSYHQKYLRDANTMGSVQPFIFKSYKETHSSLSSFSESACICLFKVGRRSFSVLFSDLSWSASKTIQTKEKLPNLE